MKSLGFGVLSHSPDFGAQISTIAVLEAPLELGLANCSQIALCRFKAQTVKARDSGRPVGRTGGRADGWMGGWADGSQMGFHVYPNSLPAAYGAHGHEGGTSTGPSRRPPVAVFCSRDTCSHTHVRMAMWLKSCSPNLTHTFCWTNERDLAQGTPMPGLDPSACLKHTALPEKVLRPLAGAVPLFTLRVCWQVA